MDNLILLLKKRICIAYSDYLVKLVKGYPMKGYSDIKEAIEAIIYIETYDISDIEKEKILDFYLLKLR